MTQDELRSFGLVGVICLAAAAWIISGLAAALLVIGGVFVVIALAGLTR